MPLPGNGILSLQGHSRPGDTVHSKPKQAMIVRMSAETLELLEEFPNQSPMDFQFGENPGIFIGDVFFPMRPLKENSPHELYLRTSSAAKPMAPLKLYANVTGKFTVERELGEKVQDKVRDRTLVAEKKRTERQAILLSAPPNVATTNGKKRKQQPASASTMFRKPVQPTDLLPSTHTSVPARVASPLPPPPTREALVPVRKRLIHCLAVTPYTANDVVRLVGGADCDSSVRRDILALLDEVAEQIPAPKKGADAPAVPWRLKTRSWLEVRPYEWPQLSESNRTAMARSARIAFKDMGIPESGPEWNHVRYRNASNGVPAAPATSSGKSKHVDTVDPPKTTKSDTTKRGTSSKDKSASKDKSTSAKAESSKAKKAESSKAKAKAEVLAKDEGVRALPKIAAGKNKKVDDSEEKGSPSPSSRRLPGSGFKAVKNSQQESQDGYNIPRKLDASSDVRSKDREPPAPSSAKSAQPSSNHSRKSTGGPSTAVGRMKKVKETAVDSEWDKDRDSERDRDRDRDKQVDKSDRKKDRLKKDAGDSASVGTKRKKIRESDEDAFIKSGEQKRRKTDHGLVSVPPTASSREPEQRPRDLSLPKKPEMALPPRPKAKRESSPPHSWRIKKDPSPPLPRPKMRKEASPLPPSRPSVVSHGKASSGSSGSSFHRPDPPSTEKTNGSASKPRRKSPIYTSSEDDEIHPPPPPPKTAKRDVPSSSRRLSPPPARPHLPARTRPSNPLPTDHAALRARYNSRYPEYITSFQQIVMQRRKAESLLRSAGAGSVGSITDSSDDVELMDAEELAKLRAAHAVLTEELESIQQAFGKSVKAGTVE